MAATSNPATGPGVAIAAERLVPPPLTGPKACGVPRHKMAAVAAVAALLPTAQQRARQALLRFGGQIQTTACLLIGMAMG